MAELAKCTNTEPHDAHQLVDGMFTISCPGVGSPLEDKLRLLAHMAAGPHGNS